MAGARPEESLLERLPAAGPLSVRARFLGERIDTKGLSEAAPSLGPVTLAVGKTGLAVVMRYGTVVFINVDASEETRWLDALAPRIERGVERPLVEEAVITRQPHVAEGVGPGGINIVDLSLPHLQLVATVLARSVALDYYESSIADTFDLIEPLARRLEQPQRGGRQLRVLLRHIGSALLAQQRMIGRVEIQDKPDLLWDHPELERFYLRLETDYELSERGRVLERKLDLIARTAETALDLLQNRSMLRVEWYIVVLIVVEVVLYLYNLFAGG